MAALTNGNTDGLGSTTDQTSTDPTNGAFQQANADTNGLDQLISDATTTQIQDQIQNQLNKETTTTPTGPSTPIGQQPQTNNPTPTVPLPNELALRILTSPDFYLANKYSFWHQGTYIGPTPWDEEGESDSPGSHGILGGDDQKYWCGLSPGACTGDQRFFQVATDDFDATANVADGRATGTVNPQIERTGFQGWWPTFGRTAASGFDFPIFNTPGVHSVTNAMVWDIGPNGEVIDPLVLKGVAFTGRDGGFFAYQMFETRQGGQIDYNKPVLAFGGNTFEKPAGESDLVRLFNLYSDPRQGVAVPFSAAAFVPKNPNVLSVSPLYLLESSTSVTGPNYLNSEAIVDQLPQRAAPSVWVQTSYVVQGTGANQQSLLVLALGTYDAESGALTGVRRGSAAFSISLDEAQYTEMVSLSGSIASLANPEGAHLMGNTIPHMLIGANSTGPAHDIFKDDPLIQQADPASLLGATYHVGEQVASVKAEDLKKTPGDYYGYATGAFQQVEGWGNDREISGGFLMNDSPDEVHLKFKNDNRLSALFALDVLNDPNTQETETGGANLAFGDWGNYSQGHSAFVGDKIYAATEANIQTTVTVEDYLGLKPAEATSYLVSGGLLNPNAQLCTDCSFMRWGAWGSELKFKNGDWEPTTADINLGWYVAGDVINDVQGELPTMGSASYAGNTIGNVATLQNEVWKTYIATGKVDMSWNFQHRSGQFDITQFDKSVAKPNGYAFGGKITMPGGVTTGVPTPTGLPNKFTGGIAGSGLAGSVTGSFVRGPGQGPNSVPAGAIGNWNAGNANYRAGGIWGAHVRP